jgi:hypothetical protein
MSDTAPVTALGTGTGAVSSPTGGKVFDLDAARAQRREASGQGSEFTFGGSTFTVPPSSEWPISVRDQLSSGEVASAMQGILGDQWAEFDKLGPTIGDVSDLLDWVASENGMGSAGKSSGSSSSSRSTPKRSKRTSSGTTGSTSTTITAVG